MTKKKKALFVLFGILLLTSYRAYPKEENNLKEKADRCLDFMIYKDAITYYSQAIKKSPESIGLRVDKAFANFQLGNEEEAIEDLHEEITQFPKSNYAYVLLSYIYYHQNKFKEAKKTSLDFDTRLKKHFRTTEIYSRGSYQRAVSLKGEFPIPNMGLPNFILGLCSKKEKKFKDAARNFAFAYQRGYNPVECCSHIIDTELVQEHWKLAIPWARRLIKKMGPQAEFYFLWGYAYYQLGNMKNAISNFKKAIKLKPFFVEGIRNLALIYYIQNKFDEAAHLFSRVLKMSHSDSKVKFYLEKCLNEDKYSENDDRPILTKDFIDNVKLEYKYPLKSDINYVSKVINSWALSSVKEGNINGAKSMLRRFLEIHDAPPLLYYNLGQIYNMFNEYESALQYAHKAIEIKKDFKEAYDLIGNIYFKIEDYEHSLLAYKEVIDIDSTDAMGHYNLGCVHHALEHFNDAEKCWKDALHFGRELKILKEKEKISEDELNISMIVEEAPVSLKAHKSLGKFYLDRNQITKALKHYKSAYELSPDDPELCYKLGKIYYDQDEGAIALHYFEKYLFLGGEEEEVIKLINQIKEKRL